MRIVLLIDPERLKILANELHPVVPVEQLSVTNMIFTETDHFGECFSLLNHKQYRASAATEYILLDVVRTSVVHVEIEVHDLNLLQLACFFLLVQTVTALACNRQRLADAARVFEPQLHFDQPRDWLWHAALACVVFAPAPRSTGFAD